MTKGPGIEQVHCIPGVYEVTIKGGDPHARIIRAELRPNFVSVGSDLS